MRLLIAGAALLALSTSGFSQEVKTKIEKSNIQYTNPGSGAEMFNTYCAACHGLDGKGTGPAAAALRKAPANLTLLTKRNNGKFPILAVQSMIKGDNSPAAHGSRDMPMWGDLFRSVSNSPAVVEMRVRNLRDYLQSIQEP